MHQSIVPSSGPKLKLVEAAERLFAEYGFEAVSVRDITQACGGNVAAVNYHFGSRDGLVAAVVSRHLTPINEARMARLDALEEKWVERPIPIEELFEAIVSPIIERLCESSMGESLYCKLTGRILGLSAGLPASTESQLSGLIHRLKRMASRSLPDVSVEELVWRLHFAMGGMLHLLTHRESMERLAEEAAGKPTMGTLVRRFVEFAAAGMRGGEAAVAVTTPVRRVAPEAVVMAPEAVVITPEAIVIAPEAIVIAPEAVVIAPEALERPVVPEVVAPPSEVVAAEEMVEELAADAVELGESVLAVEKSPKRRTKKTGDEGPQGFFSF